MSFLCCLEVPDQLHNNNMEFHGVGWGPTHYLVTPTRVELSWAVTITPPPNCAHHHTTSEKFCAVKRQFKMGQKGGSQANEEDREAQEEAGPQKVFFGSKIPISVVPQIFIQKIKHLVR